MDLLLTTDFFTEVGTWYRLVISSLLFFMLFDRLTLSVVNMTLLLKKRWMLLISLGSTDGNVYLDRWVCLIKETVLSGLLPFGDAVVRPFLGECEAHDPHAPSPQSMGKVVYMPVVNRPQIRDGPMQRQQRLSGRWAYADREAA
jgi:hypothetical protein